MVGLGVADEYVERVLTSERAHVTHVASGADFGRDSDEQLRMAVRTVFGSWDGKRAHDHRRAAGISDEL